MTSKLTWKSIQTLAFVVLGVFGLAGPVFGQTVITQTSTTRFPIMLASGSYKLGSNLSPPVNTNAINVKSNNVTIDLNGFSIIGSPTTPVLAIFGSSWTGIVVKNGVLSGLCMALGQNALVEDIVALNCAMTDGIDVGSNSTVVRSEAVSLHDSGITCGGTSGGNNCLFADDTANGNPINGITCVGNGCNFARNTANGNGALVTGNGLDCNGSGCLFNDNVSNSNAGAGIATLDHTSAVTGNVLNGNSTVPFGGATSLGNNLCNGSPC
jgi:hypothetical protein